MRPRNIAIVGATGAVGVEILRVMERRNVPVASLKLMPSTSTSPTEASWLDFEVAWEEVVEG